MKIKLKTIKTFLLTIGLSSVLFYSCSSNEDMMLENTSSEAQEVLNSKELDIKKLKNVSTAESGRNTNATLDCSNIRVLTNDTFYSYSSYYWYVPMGAQYQYYYNAETTYVIQKYYNTGDFYYDFRIAGECGVVDTIANSDLVGTWKIFNSNVTEYDINSELTLTITADGAVTLKGCNTFFGIDAHSYTKDHNDGGRIEFNTSSVASTRFGCSDNKDELINKIITELGKAKEWVKTTSSDGKIRVSFVEDSTSRFILDPQIHLEFITQ
ncbi:META domain-containing protein [Tenacibaculum xiamenense]|uniref:META domain-containing protein n=1 Tax=Tenacibaculum xiamenense TaxID=1261553 RepID=UPI0038966437